MTTLEAFLAYAAEFEKTYVDDDWTRLEPYFGDATVYRVESEVFGCELLGPSAIFAGIKKSLDGLDRNFPVREIAILEGPDVEGDELRATWTVTYRKEDWSPLVLRGRSFARIRDDKIELLVDSYDERMDRELAEWTRDTGAEVDPSYV